jgi:c-di-GMP-related signal transduction protein
MRRGACRLLQRCKCPNEYWRVGPSALLRQNLRLPAASVIWRAICELTARFCDLNDTEQYLLGLLSLLPAMLRTPAHEVVSWLPLREEIRRSLLGEKLPERCLLSWLEGQEQAIGPFVLWRKIAAC